LQPKEDGWSPPSDTNVLRLLESNLCERHVQAGHACNSHLQMVGEDSDTLQQFFHQNPPLSLLSRSPEGFDVEVGQHLEN
jgi:hypothetical protein